MGLPVVIKIFPQDSVLWISDFSANYLVSAVNKKSGSVLCQIARRGNGPSEMTPPVHLFFHNRDLCLYDRNKRQLYSTSKDSILRGNRMLNKLISFDNGYSLVYNLTDSTYIGSGTFEKRFSITDAKGNELYQTGELPLYWDGEDNLSNRVRSMYHQTTRLCQHPTLPVFATATSDVITAYRVENDNINAIFQLPMHDYSFDYDDVVFLSTNKHPDVPVGIKDIACDDKYIYVLYDPNLQAQSHTKNSEIRLYNWEGVLVKILIPNVDFEIITLDVGESTIYGIAIEGEYCIWSVQL